MTHRTALDLLGLYTDELTMIRDATPAYTKRLSGFVTGYLRRINVDRGNDPDAPLDLATVTRTECVASLVALRKASPGSRGLTDVYSPATVHSMVSSMKGFTRWAADSRYVDVDPMAGIPTPRVPRKPQQATTPAEFELLWTQAGATAWPARTRLALALFWADGMRIDEVCSLDLPDVKRNLAGVPDHLRFQGKGGHVREVPLSSPVRVLLSAYLRERDARLAAMGATSDKLLVSSRRRRVEDGIELNTNAISIELRNLRKAAGIHVKGTGAHAFRRGFATLGCSSEAYDDSQMAAQLGHAHANVGGRYRHVGLDELRRCNDNHPSVAQLQQLLER